MFTANAEHFLYTKSPVFGSNTDFFVGPRRLMFHSKFVIRCFGFGIEKHVEISTLVQNSNFHYSFGCIGNLIFAWSSKNGHFHIMNNCNKFKLLAEKRYFWQTNFRLEPNFHTISITFFIAFFIALSIPFPYPFHICS